MSADQRATEYTEDTVLGGRVRLRQPARGHRVGHDAILLAASCPAQAGERVVDLGAGVGGAGLALAQRVDGITLALVERDDALAALAADNAVRNTAERVRVVTLDVAAPAARFAAAGLPPQSADRVLMNPPFNDPARQRVSPDPRRRAAHAAPANALAAWVKTALRLLRPNGTLTLIWRADGLGEVIASLPPAFGAIAVQPVHPKPEAPAIRVLVRATKGSRAPLALLPGLVLNDANGRPTPAAEAVLIGGAALPLADSA